MENKYELHFKEIPNFNDYKINELGQIFHGNKQIKIGFSNQNIPIVRLRDDMGYHIFTVAKLVALAFLGEPEISSDVVMYKDGNNHNYALSNLMWASRSEAYSKMYDKENRYSETRLQNLRKTVCRPIVAYTRDKITMELTEKVRYDSIVEAARQNGVSGASISRCLRDPKGMSAGCYWRYADTEEE